MKNVNHKTPDTFNFFDEGPEEPNLCELLGFGDYSECFFRQSTLKRITQSVEQLRRGRV